MAAKSIARFLIPAAALGAFVIYFGTSIPDSIPDCHSSAARDEFEAALPGVEGDAAGKAIGVVREIGRTFDSEGHIDSYNCEVVVRNSRGPDVFRVQLRGEGNAVSARILGSAERL